MVSSDEDVLDLTSPEKQQEDVSPPRRQGPSSGLPETHASTQGRSRRKRARPSYLEAYDDGQCFDASQPTASQLLPPPMSPEARLPTQQHRQPSSSPNQSRSSSHAAAEPGALDVGAQHCLQGVGTGDSPVEALQAGSGLRPMEVLPGLCGESSDVGQAIPLSDVDPAGTARHGADGAGGGQAIPRAVSTADKANDGRGAACEADVEVLADSPSLPSGAPDSPTASSDLLLESSPGAAPKARTAPLAQVESARARPARKEEVTLPRAEVSIQSPQWGFSPERRTAQSRQSPLASEAMPADSDSDGELEEPLWQPEPAPKAPPRGRAKAKTAEDKAAAAAAKEQEKQQRKEARERARQEKAAQKEQEKLRRAQERLDRQRDNGKTAHQDILPVLCPSAMNHATTLRIMERLRADEFTYEVNAGGALPLGRHGLCSMMWRRRVYRAAQQAEETAAASNGPEAAQYEEVPYVLVYATGEKFVQLLERQSLEAFLGQVAAAHTGCTLSLCLEGLQAYLRRRQNAEYRALGPGAGGFNAAAFDEVLARLVLDHPCVRHRCVADAAEAADHISQLTKALAIQPFKVQDSYLHQFGGSGKNSKGVKETLARYPLRSRALEPWFHALSFVVDISPVQAHAIVTQHASLGQLMAVYADPSRTQREKENLVADLKAPGNSQRVGPRASQKLHALFTATDPLMQLGELGFKG